MIQSSIYFGEVLHSRSHPKKHSFKYKYRSLFNKNIYDFKLKKFNKFKLSFSSYDFNDEIIRGKIIKWFSRFIEKNSLNFGEIINYLSENNIKILDIVTEDGDLEDVFVQLTNR